LIANDKSDFECGNANLNRLSLEFAGQQHKLGSGMTFVLTDTGSRCVLGFVYEFIKKNDHSNLILILALQAPWFKRVITNGQA
jgi:hypothetical protein